MHFFGRISESFINLSQKFYLKNFWVLILCWCWKGLGRILYKSFPTQIIFLWNCIVKFLWIFEISIKSDVRKFSKSCLASVQIASQCQDPWSQIPGKSSIHSALTQIKSSHITHIGTVPFIYSARFSINSSSIARQQSFCLTTIGNPKPILASQITSATVKHQIDLSIAWKEVMIFELLRIASPGIERVVRVCDCWCILHIPSHFIRAFLSKLAFL